MIFCRSEEHTSELQSRVDISYAVFCLKKKKNNCSPRSNVWHAYPLAVSRAHGRRAPCAHHRATSLRVVRLARRPDVVFFFNDTATTEIYTLSLHDALPI